MDVIQIIDVSKYYGDILAVDHVNISVKEGEFFGLLGPNGAGKTTLIRILTGLATPSSGKVLVSGYDILREPVKAKKQFGLVPETSNLYVDLTAWENLMFTAKLYGVGQKERSEEAIKFLGSLGLKERINDPVKQFSKGMKRRLTIAAALIHGPRILFLDEPTGGLDVQSSMFIREMLRKLNDEGVTIFLTTHFIEEADQLCDRLAILNKGKLSVIDTPENLKASAQATLEEVFIKYTGIDSLMAERMEQLRLKRG